MLRISAYQVKVVLFLMKYQISNRRAQYFADTYDNGEKKPFLKLDWSTRKERSPFQDAATSAAHRKVNITLAPIPKSKILTDEELK